MVVRKVTVRGQKELKAKLKKMGADAAGPLLDAAVQAGAEVIRTQAVINAPYRTGTLRRSLHTEKEV